jgi:hypothetical protein
MSLSLSSSLHTTSLKHRPTPSSLHLSPNTFSHFWSWVALFDTNLSLPVRQGSLYSRRAPSPKFGRHLATLKYRISLARVFIQHAYIDDSRESWIDGVTPFVGVKAMIDEFQADLHQRDQEMTVPGPFPDTFKVVRHKSMYAAEVVLKGLDLRLLLATFVDPLKQSVSMSPPPQRNDYRSRNDLPVIESSSPWIDPDDFVETDWKAPSSPTVHLLPIAVCPHLTYFKRKWQSSTPEDESSKFGVEDTHLCLLDKEARRCAPFDFSIVHRASS